MPRLCGGPSVHDAGRGDPRDGAEGHHLHGRPEQRVRRERAEIRSGALRARCADPRHLLRRTADGACAGRRRPDGGDQRVRQDGCGHQRRLLRCQRSQLGGRRQPALQGCTEAFGRVDEPHRPHRAGAGRFRSHGGDGGLPGRGDGRRGARILRGPVPSGGHAQPVRQAHAALVRARCLPVRRRLGDGLVRREVHPGDPREGRRRQGALRPVRRRRQLGCGGPAQQGGRQAADLCIRRPGSSEKGRGRPGRGGLRSRRSVRPQLRARQRAGAIL